MPPEHTKLEKIISTIRQEFWNATEQFGKFHNAHEGYAVLLEEVNELWEAIKLNQANVNRDLGIQKEAIQVGAMAIRILFDCIY